MNSRKFRLWYYTCGHSTLIIRSTKTVERSSTIDYIFSAVEHINCPEIMTNLIITETDIVNSTIDKGYTRKKFTLTCEEGKFTVIGLAFSCYETLLEHWDLRPYLPGDQIIEREQYAYSLTKPVTGTGTFAKQINGRGQYGEIEIRLKATAEPYLIGRVIVESLGEIPKEYLPAIRKTLSDCRKQWPSLDFPVTFIDIVITGGQIMMVDESEFAYIQASILAWQNAIYKAQGYGYLQKMKLVFEEGKPCYKAVTEEFI